MTIATPTKPTTTTGPKLAPATVIETAPKSWWHHLKLNGWSLAEIADQHNATPSEVGQYLTTNTSRRRFSCDAFHARLNTCHSGSQSIHRSTPDVFTCPHGHYGHPHNDDHRDQHCWILPQPGDTDLVCGICFRRIPAAVLSRPMFEALIADTPPEGQERLTDMWAGHPNTDRWNEAAIRAIKHRFGEWVGGRDAYRFETLRAVGTNTWPDIRHHQKADRMLAADRYAKRLGVNLAAVFPEA